MRNKGFSKHAEMLAVLAIALVLVVSQVACSSATVTDLEIGLTAFRGLVIIVETAGALSNAAVADVTKIENLYADAITVAQNGGNTLDSVLTELVKELPQFAADVGASGNKTLTAVIDGIDLLVTTILQIQGKTSLTAVSGVKSAAPKIPSAKAFAIEFNRRMVADGHPEAQIAVPAR